MIFTRLEARPGRRGELVEAFTALHDAVAQEPGTIVFAMHESSDEPDVLLFYEVYADEYALDEHRGSPAVRSIVPRLADLLAGVPQITYASPLRAKGVALP